MKEFNVEWIDVSDPDFFRELVLLKAMGDQLRILRRETYQTRGERTVSMVIEALSMIDRLPQEFEIPIYTGDASWRSPQYNGLKVLAYSTSDGPACEHIVPIPDFIFKGWPEAGITSYEDVAAECIRVGNKEAKYDDIFWIGSPLTNPLRQEAVDRFRYIPGFSIRSMSWGGNTTVNNVRASNYVTIPNHAEHSVLCDLPAGGYSGRFKLLLWTGRPVIVFRSPYKEFFFKHLIHERNCYMVGSLDELEDAGKKLLRNKILAREIGNGGRILAENHLTYPRALTYLCEVLRANYFE